MSRPRSSSTTFYSVFSQLRFYLLCSAQEALYYPIAKKEYIKDRQGGVIFGSKPLQPENGALYFKKCAGASDEAQSKHFYAHIPFLLLSFRAASSLCLSIAEIVFQPFCKKEAVTPALCLTAS